MRRLLMALAAAITVAFFASWKLIRHDEIDEKCLSKPASEVRLCMWQAYRDMRHD